MVLHMLPFSIEHFVYLAAALVPALTFHEWGHAFMATRFGDDTPRMMGRLTLNPLAHLDVLGTIAIFLIGFGWAKPVPVNPNRFRNDWGEFWVAAAGPGMNILLAIFFACLLNFQVGSLAGPYASVATSIFQVSLFLNLALAFFNLLPIGPLDGRYMLEKFLPRMMAEDFRAWNLQYGGIVLLGVIIADGLLRLGILATLIRYPSQLVASLLLV